MSREEYNDIEQQISIDCKQNAISYIARLVAQCIDSIRTCKDQRSKSYWHNRALIALSHLNKEYGFEIEKYDEDINGYILKDDDYDQER